MIDNVSLGVFAAILLSLSPQLLHAGQPEDFSAIYAEAQKEAQYILETGDASKLAGIEGLERELALSAGPVMPLLRAAQLEILENAGPKPLSIAEE